MSLKQQLSEDLKTAMKSGEKLRLESIRALRAALMEREIALRQGGEATLTDEQELQVLQNQVKRRRDSIDMYRAAGRDELADKEAAEVAILQDYLPAQRAEADVQAVVDRIATEVGATSPADLKILMPKVMAELKGKAEGRLIQQIVKARLGG